MKTAITFCHLFVICTMGYAQFEKHEKIIGGSFELLTVKEKNTNTQSGGGSPFPGYNDEEKYLSISPEFGYTVRKNLVAGIFGSVFSRKDVAGGPTTSKQRGFTAGGAITKYKFFTKGFGLLLRLKGSYSSSREKTYQGVDVYENNFYLTNFSLNGGAFYRFSKHFSVQMMLGNIMYDHLVSSYQGNPDHSIKDRFTGGFYKDVNLSVFYILKKVR